MNIQITKELVNKIESKARTGRDGYEEAYFQPFKNQYTFHNFSGAVTYQVIGKCRYTDGSESVVAIMNENAIVMLDSDYAWRNKPSA